MLHRSAEARSFFHDGARLVKEGDLARAELAYRQALLLDPALAEAHANIALLLERDNRIAEAEAHYRRSLDLAPRRPQMYLNYGAMLAGEKRFAEAEKQYRAALFLDPRAASAWSNLGALLACTRREAEAIQCYRFALDIDPGHRAAQFNLAYVLLRQGHFEEGWRCLEARDGYGPVEALLSCPRWNGEPLQGKTVLIGVEAGHGDMIQFCRYAPALKAAGASRVSILCHPGLKSLLARLPGVDETIASDETFSRDGWDCWTPALSLPFLFRTRLDTIPAQIPYLTADVQHVAQWSRVMEAPAGECRVGLVWKGNPRFENDRDRSLPSLATLSPLQSVPRVRFFGLQKGTGEDEVGQNAVALNLVDLGPHIQDFADTAAIVMNLDLVITVDTAVAHLAGALGKPCWVLLPEYKTDWRWLTGREDSPWYPDVMRLFRQEIAGDWTPVVQNVATALAQFVR